MSLLLLLFFAGFIGDTAFLCGTGEVADFGSSPDNTGTSVGLETFDINEDGSAATYKHIGDV